MLRAEGEANPCQTVEELPSTECIQQSRPSTSIHLRQIGEGWRGGVRVPLNLSAQEPSQPILIESQEMKNGLRMLIQSTKSSGCPQNKHQEVLRNRLYIPKRRFCALGGISVELLILKYLNLGKLLKQIFTVNNWIEWINHQWEVCGDLQQKRRHSATPQCKTALWEKHGRLGWEVLPHPLHSPDLATSDYHLYRSLQHLLSCKKVEQLEDVQIPGFLLKNHNIFIGSALKICSGNIERLLIITSITLSVKNKVLIKTCKPAEVNVKKTTSLILWPNRPGFSHPKRNWVTRSFIVYPYLLQSGLPSGNFMYHPRLEANSNENGMNTSSKVFECTSQDWTCIASVTWLLTQNKAQRFRKLPLGLYIVGPKKLRKY